MRRGGAAARRPPRLSPGSRARPRTRGAAVALALAGSLSALSPRASGEAVFGACRFELSRLSFVGTPVEQARCLFRPPARPGLPKAPPTPLPEALEGRIGRPVRLPAERLAAALHAAGVALAATGPLSRAYGNDPYAPEARYFVIHDTSQPFYGLQPFPPDLDADPVVADIARYAGENAVAHLFVSRTGLVLVGHELDTPWRATKLESRAIGLPAKGLFIHVETVEPRRSDPMGVLGNDAVAPVPGFTPVQYQRLALLYAAASARAGTWLIPAFHADLDEGFEGAHDDPQNVSVAAFAAALERVCADAGETSP